MDDATGKQCWMVHQHLKNCPSCSKQHVSDRWLIERMVESCYTFRNSEPSCETRGIFSKESLLGNPQEYIYQIVESPHSESPFVKLFLAKRGEHIISNGVSLYKFDNTIWRKMADNVAALAMQESFDELLPALLALVHAEDPCVRPHNSQFTQKRVKVVRKQLCTAIGHTRSQTGINNLVKNMKIQAFVDQLEEVFDKNLNLLAFDDGVLDLRNRVFRPGRAEDMITKTVGYSFNKVADAFRTACHWHVAHARQPLSFVWQELLHGWPQAHSLMQYSLEYPGVAPVPCCQATLSIMFDITRLQACVGSAQS